MYPSSLVVGSAGRILPPAEVVRQLLVAPPTRLGIRAIEAARSGGGAARQLWVVLMGMGLVGAASAQPSWVRPAESASGGGRRRSSER